MNLKWKGKIIDIYILKEVFKPFLIGVAIITVILLSNFLFQLADLFIVKNVQILKVIKLLIYQLPDIVVQTFPIAILLGTMVGLGRLNRENELTALRMGGFSLYRLIIPLIIFGIIVSGLTFYLNEKVVPWANHQAQNIIRLSILKEAMPDVEEDVFFKGPKGKLFYVGKYDQDSMSMKKIVIYNLSKNSSNFSSNNAEDKGYPEIITANSGQVVKNQWRLKNGFIHRYNQNGHLTIETSFDQMKIELASDLKQLYGEQKTPSEMSRTELAKEIKFFQKSGIKADSLMVDYYLKLAIPFTSLIFILIGAPLTLGNKDSRILSITLTVIIIFSYYIILSLSRSFGRNGMLPPLIAAWFPDLFFTLLGIVLLIYRELWQGWLQKLKPSFMFISSIFLPTVIIVISFSIGPYLIPFSNYFLHYTNYTSHVQAMTLPEQKIIVDNTDVLKLKADHLQYDKQDLDMSLVGNIKGQYGKLFITAKKITVKLKDGSNVYTDLKDMQQIDLAEGTLTGCELEKPHYFFKAEEVIIYPDDHLEAKNVCFWELQGSVPLFYWPYLYISLKEESQRLLPQIGYSQSRGWFAKLTYNYWLNHRLPGAIYTDYYKKSGLAGGIKQYFIYEPEKKGSIYFYTQQNKPDIPGLFEWQGKFDYVDQSGDWQTDSNLQYTRYDNYDWIKGDIRLTNNQKNQWLSFYSDFDSEDYNGSDEHDDKQMSLDFNYTRNLKKGWEVNLNFNQVYLLNPEDGLKSRWGSKSYILKKAQDYDFKVLLERFAPRFTTDDESDKVTFYRWPEIDYKYYTDFGITYQSQLGRYFEKESDLDGYRFLNRIDYSDWWQVTNNTIFKTEQVLTGKNYETTDPQEVTNNLLEYENEFKLKTTLFNNFIWTNTYNFGTYRGVTPFNFDQPDNTEKIRSNLNFYSNGLNTTINGGYNIYEQKYLPLTLIMDWRVNSNWKLGLGTSYDPEDQTYGDLALTSRYKSNQWQINSAFMYDLNNNYLKQWDNELVYEVKNDWYLGVKNSYDYKDNQINEANLILKKTFHCRELWFTYDQKNQSFMIEYQINLLPDHGVKFGSSKDEPFMFDFGIRELLGLEGGTSNE